MVWHIRTFDHAHATHICRSCKPGYISGLNSFVDEVLSKLNNGSTVAGGMKVTRRDVVVHREVKVTMSQPVTQDGLNNATFMRSEDLSEVLCTFANADLLVATGGSLPAVLMYFLPKYRPVVLEDIRLVNDAYLFKLNPQKNSPALSLQARLAPGRSFHLLNGQPDQNVTVEAIAEALRVSMSTNLVSQ